MVLSHHDLNNLGPRFCSRPELLDDIESEIVRSYILMHSFLEVCQTSVRKSVTLCKPLTNY